MMDSSVAAFAFYSITHRYKQVTNTFIGGESQLEWWHARTLRKKVSHKCHHSSKFIFRSGRACQLARLWPVCAAGDGAEHREWTLARGDRRVPRVTVDPEVDCERVRWAVNQE